MQLIGWRILQQVAHTGNSTVLYRSRILQAKYDMHKIDIQHRFDSIEDYMLNKAFNVPLDVNPTSNKLRARNIHFPDVKHKLLQNDFPYYVEPHISHQVLWATKQLSRQEIDQVLESIMIYQTKRYLFFVNPLNLRSIPGLFHAHVFSMSLLHTI
jgi:hypothetical protein